MNIWNHWRDLPWLWGGPNCVTTNGVCRLWAICSTVLLCHLLPRTFANMFYWKKSIRSELMVVQLAYSCCPFKVAQSKVLIQKKSLVAMQLTMKLLCFSHNFFVCWKPWGSIGRKSLNYQKPPGMFCAIFTGYSTWLNSNDFSATSRWVFGRFLEVKPLENGKKETTYGQNSPNLSAHVQNTIFWVRYRFWPACHTFENFVFKPEERVMDAQSTSFRATLTDKLLIL